jgi:hypothetical protein
MQSFLVSPRARNISGRSSLKVLEVRQSPGEVHTCSCTVVEISEMTAGDV